MTQPITISTQSSGSDRTLSAEELRKIHNYWRAANYLSVGQIYLYDNPLLKEPLKLEHIKPRLLGHWGTTPGLNFIYVHFNRIIKKYDLNVLYIAGPGHGGPALVANTYLEGSYSEYYPAISQNVAGMKRLFTHFLFRVASPATPLPKRRDRSTKEANWVTPSFTHPEPLLTTPICWSAASWGMEKPKQAPSRPVGIRTNF